MVKSRDSLIFYYETLDICQKSFPYHPRNSHLFPENGSMTSGTNNTEPKQTMHYELL